MAQSTHLTHITSCSLLAASVHSSHIMQKQCGFNKVSSTTKSKPLHKGNHLECCAKCIYHFFETQSSILGSSSPHNFKSCTKFKLISSAPSPLNASPCLDKKTMFDKIFSKQCLLFFFLEHSLWISFHQHLYN